MLKNQIAPETRRLMELQNEDPTRFFGSIEMYIILGISLGLAALLFVWAFYIRKPKPKSPRRRRIITKPAEISRSPRDGEKRQKKRRWKHRTPTLSETGGLPPRRPKNNAPDPG